jgi:hypothetical protein
VACRPRTIIATFKEEGDEVFTYARFDAQIIHIPWWCATLLDQ